MSMNRCISVVMTSFERAQQSASEALHACERLDFVEKHLSVLRSNIDAISGIYRDLLCNDDQ